MEKLKKSIRSLQRQMEEHQKNLNYLEEQEARFGPLAVPAALHHQLEKEREIMAALARQLKRAQHRLANPADIESRLKTLADAPHTSVAAVDNDIYWHGIIAEVGAAFNLTTETYTVADMLQHLEAFGKAGHRLAVVGLPSPQEFSNTINLKTWTRAIVAVSRHIPTILMTSRASRAVAIATRYALLRQNISPVATLQKETFTYEWFTKMFKKALENGEP